MDSIPLLGAEQDSDAFESDENESSMGDGRMMLGLSELAELTVIKVECHGLARMQNW